MLQTIHVGLLLVGLNGWINRLFICNGTIVFWGDCGKQAPFSSITTNNLLSFLHVIQATAWVTPTPWQWSIDGGKSLHGGIDEVTAARLECINEDIIPIYDRSHRHDRWFRMQIMQNDTCAYDCNAWWTIVVLSSCMRILLFCSCFFSMEIKK